MECVRDVSSKVKIIRHTSCAHKGFMVNIFVPGFVYLVSPHSPVPVPTLFVSWHRRFLPQALRLFCLAFRSLHPLLLNQFSHQNPTELRVHGFPPTSKRMDKRVVVALATSVLLVAISLSMYKRPYSTQPGTARRRRREGEARSLADLQAQIDRHTHILSNLAAPAPSPRRNTTDLEAKVAELTSTVTHLQLARLHDQYFEAEALREAKQKEARLTLGKIDAAKKAGQPTTTLDASLAEATNVHLTQSVVKERLLNEMRELSHPGHMKAPDPNSTFVASNETGVDVAVPFLRQSGYSFNYNAHGLWAWRPGAKHIGSVLVVFGADVLPQDTAAVLMDAGFVVWKRRYRCLTDCREAVSYLAYLSDDGFPSKPTLEYTAFVHGHKESWHQNAPIDDMVRSGVSCASKLDRYVPLGYVTQSMDHDLWGNTAERFGREYFNSLGAYGVPPTMRFLTFCCAQFVVPRNVIARNKVSFYKHFIEQHQQGKVGGYMAEFVFPYVFGEPAVVEAYGGPPRECQAVRNVVAPFTNYSRAGQWTRSDARITFVLGVRSVHNSTANAVVASALEFAPDVNVWQRHESYHCGVGGTQACCGYHKGYLDFWNDEDKPVSDVYVFLHGVDKFTKESVDTILAKVECATKRARYTPLGTIRQESTSTALGYTWLEKRPYMNKQPLLGYAGGQFVVPRQALLEARFEALQATYETFSVGCQNYRKEPRQLEHYWHWMMGEDATMEECNEDGSIPCATCMAKTASPPPTPTPVLDAP